MSAPQNGRSDYLKLGTFNVHCAWCGAKFKADEVKKDWRGFWTCPRDWESRQPQDFVRGVPQTPTPFVQQYQPSWVTWPDEGT